MKYCIALILLLCCVVCVYADVPANQTAETQGLSSITNVAAEGLVTESDSVVWQGSSYILDDTLSLPVGMAYFTEVAPGFYQGWIDTPWGPISYGFADTPTRPIADGDILVLDDLTGFAGYGGIVPKVAGEVQYTTSYRENTIADSGHTTYTKSLDIDTRNKVANQDNLKTDKIVSFAGDEMVGAITSDESLLLDTAGEVGGTENLFICPFGSNILEIYPQFCNIEEMGSTAYMKEMLMTTSANDRFLAASADTPVAMDYSILVNGIGDAPAIGEVSAYINIHSMDGRAIKMWDHYQYGGNAGFSIRPGLAMDNVYNEETTAMGIIYQFQKDMSYTSGIHRVT